jgi:hypothetical protein
MAAQAGIDQVLALTDLDNVASQRVAARLGRRDEGVTDRWVRPDDAPVPRDSPAGRPALTRPGGACEDPPCPLWNRMSPTTFSI